MPTITIRLDGKTDLRLKRRLARSGETLSEFVREAITSRLDAAPPVETRLASLERVLEKIEPDDATDLSTTYKARIRERLDARHRR